MDLIKKNIHMNRQKSKAVSQLTLDDDFNVPDTKPDMGKIIQEKGNIKIEEMKPQAEHVGVKGALEFQVLYLSDDGDRKIHSLEGAVPFEEMINIEGASDGDNIQLNWDLEDLSTNLINSRKMSVKTIVTFHLSVEELYDEETAVEVHGEDGVEYRNRGMDVLQMVTNKKDTLRIKDEIVLPSNKPNIYELLWTSVQPRGMDMRLMDGKLSVKGELLAFVVYKGEDEDQPVEWMETSLPFDGMIDCPGTAADMYSDIDTAMTHVELVPKPDYDGEERLFAVDVVLELNIKVYAEEHVDVLDDVYSALKQLVPVTQKAGYEGLLVKNFSKCRASDRIRISESEARILQLIHSSGQVKIDDVEVVDDGIEVEGVVEVQLLYITSDDSMPFNSMRGMVPFHHVIEAPGIDEECIRNLKTDLEQLSTTMIDSEEIEVKATINLNALVLKRIETDIITDVLEEPLDMEKVQELPGIVGYMVRSGDTLWDIAKQYYTTVGDIMETNELASDEISPGDKLIIVKQVESLL